MFFGYGHARGYSERKDRRRGLVTRMRRSPFWSGTLSMMIVIAAGCSAGTPAPRGGGKAAGRQVSSAEPGRTQDNSQIEELLRRTRPNGSARVIVQLRIPAGPEETREQRIKAAQQALLAELARVPHRILRTYTITPAVALEASHEALQVLRDSRHVLRVEEDELAKPFDKPSGAIKTK